MDISKLIVKGFIKIVSKCGRDSHFKVIHCLFQSGAIISKWGKRCFKVGQLPQSGVKSYFKVGHNISKWSTSTISTF